MIRYLLEAYPKLTETQYEYIMDIIDKYVSYRYRNLPEIELEQMKDKVVDDVFDEMYNKKIKPDKISDGQLRAFLKKAIEYSSNDFYHYNVKSIKIPKEMSYTRFKEMAHKMNDREETLLKSIYKLDRARQKYVLKTELDSDERNEFMTILHKYGFVERGVDATAFAKQLPDENDESPIANVPSSQDLDSLVQSKMNREQLTTILKQLGYTDSEIELFYLIQLYDRSYHGVAVYLLKNKPLQKQLLVGIKATLDNIRKYAYKLETSIIADLKSNKEFLRKNIL